MFTERYKPTTRAKLALSLLCLYACSCEGFNRKTTGIVFSAYIKKPEGKTKEIPNWKTYSMKDMEAMLSVISTNFSRVTTYGVGADNVPYHENSTYYTSNAQVMTAEGAARINRKRNQKSLTVLIGLYQSAERLQMNSEVFVALESADKANAIYEETVEGFVLTQDDIDSNIVQAKRTLDNLRILRKEGIRRGTNLKIGSRQKCYGLSEPIDELSILRRSIVNESNFIICKISPAETNLPSGGEAGFITVRYDLLAWRESLKDINPHIEVMGETGWPSKGDKVWENLENLEKYWKVADKWSAENNFTMWLFEAFDGPWKNWAKNASYYGWWRLKKNDVIHRLDGYVEKITGPPEPEEEEHQHKDNSSNFIVYIGVGMGVVALSLVFLAVGILYFRVKQIRDALTTDDVKEFMYGISDEAAGQQQQGCDGSLSAFQFPYDKSYEIPKDKLKIRREALLGSGQFGCVYKALIEKEEENIEVAVKMAKNDCPKSALKGILSEIKILTYLGKHPNIVSIHGAYTAELLKGMVYVATELCPLGSLESYLRKCSSKGSQSKDSIYVNNERYANSPSMNIDSCNYSNIEPENASLSDMIQWSHEIACGMEYLGTKHVVHADLSTRNVLLAADKTAKITDFGLSRKLYDYTNYVKKQQEPLPWRWMAIESLKRLEFSAKSDVWSYGVTLWEIFSLGDLPYPGLSWNLDFVDDLVNGLRMKSPPHATPAVYQIMVSTWNTEPSDRPTFTDLKLTTASLMDKERHCKN